MAKLTDRQREVLEAFGIDNTQTLEDEIETLQRLKDGCSTYLTPGTKDHDSSQNPQHLEKNGEVCRNRRHRSAAQP